jgi:integrase
MDAEVAAAQRDAKLAKWKGVSAKYPGVRMYLVRDGKDGWAERYQYRVVVEQSDGTKKEAKEGGFTTPTAAAKARRAVEQVSDQGKYADPGKYTVETWLAEWLDGDVVLKDTRKDFYRYLIRLYVAPRIGSVPLGRLTSTRIGAFMNELRKNGRKNGTGVSHGTARLVFAMLRVGLQAAVDREPALLPSNPADRNRKKIKPGAKRARTIEWWDEDELGRFLRWAWKNAPKDDALFWEVIAATGLRKSEALALRWEDVHLADGYLSVTSGKSKPDSEPRKRAVPLKGHALGALRTYKARRSADSEGELTKAGKRVFADENGYSVPPGAATARFTRAVARARRELGEDQLRRLHGLHGLRHTAASIFIVRRLPLPYIAEILGHSFRMLTETYAHIIPPADGYGAGDVMASLMAGLDDTGIELALAGPEAG